MPCLVLTSLLLDTDVVQPAHVDTENHIPAHMEFQAMLDFEEVNYTDALNMVDKMYQRYNYADTQRSFRRMC